MRIPILTAYLFLNIFSSVDRTSMYLQLFNLDLFSVWQMVEKTIKSIGEVKLEDNAEQETLNYLQI